MTSYIFRNDSLVNDEGFLPDGTILKVLNLGSELLVETMGPSFSVVEVGEQLAWLDAALHCSPSDTEIADSAPLVQKISARDSQSLGGDVSTTLCCKIVCKRETRTIQKSENGQCWQNLFRNPVIVRGFPIRRRSEYHAGLEIPLSMMATLAHALRATIFGGELIIKGFSTLLVAIKQVQDTVIWHLIYNSNGSHVSYVDPRVRHVLEARTNKVTLPALETARHVLGGCSNVKNYAGKSKKMFLLISTTHHCG